MNIGQLLDPRAIVSRASGGSKRQVLSVIADVAARTWGLDQSVVLDALLEREALLPVVHELLERLEAHLKANQFYRWARGGRQGGRGIVQ